MTRGNIAHDTSVHLLARLVRERRASHAQRLTTQRRVVPVHQRPDPLLLARPRRLLLAASITDHPHVRATQQGRRAVNVDRLVVTRPRDKRLVEETHVRVALLPCEAHVPVPSVAVDRVVREPVEAVDVAEVADHHERVVGAALGVAPHGDVQHAVLVTPLREGVGHGLEVLANLLGARAEEAERVVEAHAQVEDDEGLGRGL